MKKPIQYKGIKFLIVMIISYTLLAFLDYSQFEKSLIKVINIFSQIWPIFIFIILLTALINYFLKPQSIIKHFGKDSGTKGVAYAIAAGIISHGPMYAWYGLIQELREKGAKDELLIIFFYSRAIKIPMIPFSIAVFGTPFTILISVFILLFALLQGKLFTYLYHK